MSSACLRYGPYFTDEKVEAQFRRHREKFAGNRLMSQICRETILRISLWLEALHYTPEMVGRPLVSMSRLLFEG